MTMQHAVSQTAMGESRCEYCKGRNRIENASSWFGISIGRGINVLLAYSERKGKCSLEKV